MRAAPEPNARPPGLVCRERRQGGSPGEKPSTPVTSGPTGEPSEPPARVQERRGQRRPLAQHSGERGRPPASCFIL